MEFSISGGFTSGMHGNSHRKIFELRNDLVVIKRKRKKQFFHPNRGMKAAEDFVLAISLLDKFHGMENKKGHGLYAGIGLGLNGTIRDVFFQRDAITVNVGYYGLGAWQPWLDHENYNLKIGLTDKTGPDWLSDLKDLNKYFGPKHPKTEKAVRFGTELEAMGYPFPIAMMLAWLAEESGYDFPDDGPSRALITEMFYNNLYGGAPSLESGADPFEGNKSGLFSRGIIWQEFGISYSVGITKWFSVGMSLKYMRAWRISSFSEMNDISINDFNITKATDLRHSFGLDLGLTFMPTDGVAMGLSVRNLSFPTFKWDNLKVQFIPQVRANFDYRMADDVPLWISSELDLNRVESSLLRGLHHQEFRFGLSLKPDYDMWGMVIGLGTSKNIGDSNEPWLMEGNLGVRVWKLGLDVKAGTTFEPIYGINSYVDFTLPGRFSLSASLSFKYDF